MDKSLNTTILIDIYGQMLTKRQYNILNDYYNNDLSLTEIAENEGISRQAVNDNIKKGEQKLYTIESKLNIMEKTFKRQDKIESILANLKNITKKTTDKEIDNIVNEIKEELQNIV